MKAQKSTLAHIRLVLLICSLIVYGNLCLAQTVSSGIEPVKLDEYGDLPTDDEAAYLDLFAERLFKQPKLHGYILAYTEPRMERGAYLRRIYGIGRYLTEARGIEPNRVVVVDGGYREKFATQLWLVPEGAEPPSPAPTVSQPQINTSSTYQFDAECLNCSPAVNLYLYGLDEGLKFYAEELRKKPNSRGLIIVRPDRNVSVREALKEARRARSLLARNHGINASRIVIRSGRSRNDGTAVVEMWIVPRGAKQPTATSNNGMHPTANSVAFMRKTWPSSRPFAAGDAGR
jgi:hypothetical protein